jgi:ABC transport system ATP-binding/permease protein
MREPEGSLASVGETARASSSLLYSGRRVPIGETGLTLGRGEDNDIVLDGERASRLHARIEPRADGGFALTDLRSRHGTLLNGELLRDQTRALHSGDTIEIGAERLRFLGGEATRVASRELPISGVQTVAFTGPRLTIGRDPRNDVVLADPNVSRFHAEVLDVGDGNAELHDLDSRNGTRLDGELVGRALIGPGSDIGVGPFRLVFDGDNFLARDDRRALRLDAQQIAMRVRDKQILEPTTLSLQPGELVVIIGESGAGKSTLLKALAGVTPVTSGRITVNGDPLANRLTDIGYVPQDEIVHGALTVREALAYAARLRLPADADERETEQTVARVLEELALSEHADTRIAALSGGQRKRASVAVELLGNPSLLLLDEPTTGMDPGLESKMMHLFRELADRSRGVALVTHATKNLALCDRVVTMGRGGVLTFSGSPQAACEFFGVEDFDGIYGALDETPAREWRKRFAGSAEAERPDAEQRKSAAKAPARRRGAGPLLQVRVLTERYLKLMLRDRRNLVLLLGQAPVLALAAVGLFKTGIFNRPHGSPGDAIQLIFLASLVMIWLGSIDAAREIIKERAVFAREAALGTRVGAYLCSKLIVLFGLVALQCLLYAALLFGLRPLHASTGTYVEVFALLVATGFAAVGMGLLISAAVSSEDQAMSFLPLAVIPQLLFAGTIVPVARMAEPAHSLATVIFARWSLASIGTSLDLNARIAQEPGFARVNRFGTHFFNVAFGSGLLIQGAFLAAFLAGIVLLLRRS